MDFLGYLYSTCLELAGHPDIIEPAEFSGYCKSWFISLRISGETCLSILSTTIAGISSTKSAASLAYRSLTISLSSESEKPLISISWKSLSISTKTSAALSFAIRRNKSGICFSSTRSKRAARSPAAIVETISFIVEYFFSSRRR